MRKLTKKTNAIIAGAVIAGLASAGGAYAYWTSSGSGTGTAATSAGAAGLLKVNQLTAPTALSPGLGQAAVTFNVQNLGGTGGQAYQVENVTVSIGSVSLAVGAVGTCTAADYSLTTGSVQPLVPVNQLVAAAATGATVTGPTLSFATSTSNQDGCKGATVNLVYTLS